MFSRTFFLIYVLVLFGACQSETTVEEFDDPITETKSPEKIAPMIVISINIDNFIRRAVVESK